MLIDDPSIPAWIAKETIVLAIMTETHNVEMLRDRRDHPRGVNVDIYHHSAGTDSYFCDSRKKYMRWSEIMEEADIKIGCGQYLFTSVIEYKAGVHFISSKTSPKPTDN